MNKVSLSLLFLVLLLAAVIPTAATGNLTADHSVTHWHAPGDYHHHGANPADAHPLLQQAMDEHWTQEIGSAWESSAHENDFPHGDHAGFKNLSETDTGCPRLPAGATCVKAYFLQVHAMGTNAHGRKDVHSIKGAFLVCDDNQCGYIVTGGWHDYIWLHAPYKRYFCEQPGDPVIAPRYQLSQVPYTALTTRLGFEGTDNEQNRIFWSSLGPNAVTADVVEANRGYIPNRGLQVVWSEVDAWDTAVGDSPLCNDSGADTRLCPDDVNDAGCRWNGTEFQVFTIRFNNLPTARPFDGYTDRHGNVVGGCTAEGLDCVPLIISAGVPQGTPMLSRNVQPDTAPLLNYDDGTLLRRPPFELP